MHCIKTQLIVFFFYLALYLSESALAGNPVYTLVHDCDISLIPKSETLLEKNTNFQNFYHQFKSSIQSMEPIQRSTNTNLEELHQSRKRAFIENDRKKMKETGIPENLWPFFNNNTGIFEYKNPHPLVVSAESGRNKLEMVRISFYKNSYGDWTAETLENYGLAMQSIFGFDLWVSVNPSQMAAAQKIVSKFPKDVRKRIWLHEVKDLRLINIWTQDGSKPLSTQDPVTVMPRIMVRPIYALSINSFAATNKLEVLQSAFKFEGGNVVVGERHMFIGTKEVQYNMKLLHATREEIIAGLEAEFGRPVIEINNTSFVDASFNTKVEQIDFHIDLTMAVVYDHVQKKEVILVESQDLFVDMLSQMSESSFRTTEEKLFLRYIQNNDLTSYYASARQQYLDATAATLSEIGYDVIRIPGYNEHATKMINFSNAIFSDKNAIVPNTGFRQLDKSFKALLMKMGYETIVPMKVVQRSSKYAGGIRCLSETYRRPSIDWVWPKE